MVSWSFDGDTFEVVRIINLVKFKPDRDMVWYFLASFSELKFAK
jgi:hypothetical protein